MTRTERDRPAALAASKASQAKAKRENAQHTPGPWQLAQDGSLGSIETVSGRVPIGHSFQTRPTRRPEGHIERIANARLMAAAPELLDALKACAAVCAGETTTKNGLINALEKARSVIWKATGETP